jgi:hypothetical protein
MCGVRVDSSVSLVPMVFYKAIGRWDTRLLAFDEPLDYCSVSLHYDLKSKTKRLFSIAQ